MTDTFDISQSFYKLLILTTASSFEKQSDGKHNPPNLKEKFSVTSAVHVLCTLVQINMNAIQI